MSGSGAPTTVELEPDDPGGGGPECAGAVEVEGAGAVEVEGARAVEVEGARAVAYRDMRVAVIAARWHAEITAGLLDGALRALRDRGIGDPTVIRVPGSFELPVAASRAARSGYDAIVALGTVVRGETAHFEQVSSAATLGLTQVAVGSGVPVGFGVLTCDTVEQARDRAGLAGSREDHGYDAARAALVTARALRTLTPTTAPARE